MPKAFLRWLTAAGVIAAGVVTATTMAVGGAGPVSSDGDTPTLAGGQQPLPLAESDEQRLESDFAFTSKRSPAPRRSASTRPESFAARRPSTRRSSARRRFRPARRRSRGAWTQVGPNPIVQAAGARRGRRDERPDRRAGHPAEQREVHPRRRAGRDLALRPGAGMWTPRRRTTSRRRRSARSRSRRPTTRSSTPAPARARSRGTRTSATAS